MEENIGLSQERKNRLGYLTGQMLRTMATQVIGTELIINVTRHGLETLRKNPPIMGYDERIFYRFTDSNGSLEIIKTIKLETKLCH